MISDNVIASIPLVKMVRRAQTLTFVTESVNGSYYMSLITPEGTVKILEFDTLQTTTDMTANFINATSGLMFGIVSTFEAKIQTIINS